MAKEEEDKMNIHRILLLFSLHQFTSFNVKIPKTKISTEKLIVAMIERIFV